MRLLERVIGAYSNDNLGIASRYFVYDSLYRVLFNDVVSINGQLMDSTGHFPSPHEATPGPTHEEPAFSRFLREVSSGMTVVDIGSGSGWFTLNGADRVRPNGEVHAFEADPDRFATLQRNIQLNGYENIKAYNMSVGVDTPVSAYVSGVDVAVVDVEGDELNVLKGLPEITDTMSDMIIICEVHPSVLTEEEVTMLYSYLRDNKFTLSCGSMNGQFDDPAEPILDELHQVLATRNV